MSGSTSLTAEEHTALTTLLGAIPEPQALSTVDCATYNTYRPILVGALPLISKIPVFGSKLNTIVTFLMTIADSVCAVPSKAEESSVKVQKSGDTQVTVTFPKGTQITSASLSEADLLVALARGLSKAPKGPITPDCIGDEGPVCVIN